MAIDDPVAAFGLVIEMDSAGQLLTKTQTENMPPEMVMAQLQVLLKDYHDQYFNKFSANKKQL